MTEVAVAQVQRGEPEPRRHCRRDREHQEGRQRQHPPAGHHAEPGHHRGEQEHPHQEVHQRGEDGGEGDQQAREVDLPDQPLVVDHAVPRLAEDGGEELPRQQRGEHGDRIGEVTGRRAPHQVEEGLEDDDRGGRLQHHPGGAEHGLLVADLEIAQRQRPEQLAIAPQLVQLDPLPTGAGAEDASAHPGGRRSGLRGRREGRGNEGGRIELLQCHAGSPFRSASGVGASGARAPGRDAPTRP